jgi:hypothetical protein
LDAAARRAQASTSLCTRGGDSAAGDGASSRNSAGTWVDGDRLRIVTSSVLLYSGIAHRCRLNHEAQCAKRR